MKILGSRQDNIAIKKIYNDKDVCNYYKKMCGWMLALSIIVLFYAIPETIKAFRNEVDWFDKLIPILFGVYGLLNLIESLVNIAKINIKKNN